MNRGPISADGTRMAVARRTTKEGPVEYSIYDRASPGNWILSSTFMEAPMRIISLQWQVLGKESVTVVMTLTSFLCLGRMKLLERGKNSIRFHLSQIQEICNQWKWETHFEQNCVPGT